MSDRPGMTYREFVDWSTAQLIDALITGGFSKLKTCFQYTVLNVLCNDIKTIFPHLFETKGKK